MKIAAVTVAAALLLIGCSSRQSGTPADPASPKVQTVASQTRCATPAPSSAGKYTRLWATIPVSLWGGADVSISVPLPDGRSVWLYGDTLSTGRFVHSTAITQDRGCLHVSHLGAQLLPNTDAHHIYWINSATATVGGVRIDAMGITITGKGAWDFTYGGRIRTAVASINAAGDVTFTRWVAERSAPMPNPGPMYKLDSRPHHFGYSRRTHPEASLASGRVLVTTCQNWDDGKLHSLSDYRPIFTE